MVPGEVWAVLIVDVLSVVPVKVWCMVSEEVWAVAGGYYAVDQARALRRQGSDGICS